MTKRGKKYRAALNNIKTNEMYSPRGAVELAKQNSVANFDETLELHIRIVLPLLVLSQVIFHM